MNSANPVYPAVSTKRFVLAFFAALVVTAAGNFIIHALLLKPMYLQNPHLLRTAADGDSHAPFLLAAFVAFSFGAVWIYARHVARSGAAAGLSYGLGLWLVATVARYVTDYAVAPWPSRVVLSQIGLELPLALLVGVVIAAILGGRDIRTV